MRLVFLISAVGQDDVHGVDNHSHDSLTTLLARYNCLSNLSRLTRTRFTQRQSIRLRSLTYREISHDLGTLLAVQVLRVHISDLAGHRPLERNTETRKS